MRKKYLWNTDKKKKKSSILSKIGIFQQVVYQLINSVLFPLSKKDFAFSLRWLIFLGIFYSSIQQTSNSSSKDNLLASKRNRTTASALRNENANALSHFNTKNISIWTKKKKNYLKCFEGPIIRWINWTKKPYFWIINKPINKIFIKRRINSEFQCIIFLDSFFFDIKLHRR